MFGCFSTLRFQQNVDFCLSQNNGVSYRLQVVYTSSKTWFSLKARWGPKHEADEVPGGTGKPHPRGCREYVSRGNGRLDFFRARWRWPNFRRSFESRDPKSNAWFWRTLPREKQTPTSFNITRGCRGWCFVSQWTIVCTYIPQHPWVHIWSLKRLDPDINLCCQCLVLCTPKSHRIAPKLLKNWAMKTTLVG